MKGYFALHVDQLLSPKYTVKQNSTKTALDFIQFLGEGGSFQKNGPSTDRFILDERSKQASIPVVGRAAKEQTLTVDVRQIMSESRFTKSALWNGNTVQ